MTVRTILAGLALAAATWIAAPAVASAADGYARADGVMRAGPDTDYPRIKGVYKGTPLAVYGCTRSYRWCDVVAEGDRGWFPGSRIGFYRDGRPARLTDVAPYIGLAIVGFAIGDYWGNYYSNRPWYHERRWWNRHGHRPPPPPPGWGPRPGVGPGPGPMPGPGMGPRPPRPGVGPGPGPRPPHVQRPQRPPQVQRPPRPPVMAPPVTHKFRPSGNPPQTMRGPGGGAPQGRRPFVPHCPPGQRCN